MPEYKLNIDLTHHSRFAKTGERIVFTAVMQEFSSRVNGELIRWKIVRNCEEVILSGEYPSEDFSGCTVLIPQKEGLYTCFFEGVVQGEVVIKGSTAVLVDPEKIKPSLPVPADFDAFWEKQISALRKMPMNPKEKTVFASAGVSVSDVEVDMPTARPLKGLLMKPDDAKAKSLPALLTLQGAGVRTAGSDNSLCFAHEGFLTFDFNVHGIENCREPRYYAETDQNQLTGYQQRGFDSGDPDKVYMKDILLRVVRAIDYLTSRPEWNGRDLIVFGGSQGGWQSFAAAALSKKVTAVSAFIPAVSDMYAGGWPFAEYIGREKPEAFRKTMPYFDNCSMCSRIGDIPVHVTYGLSDGTCKAYGVAAAVNMIRSSKKTVVINTFMGHETPEPLIADHLDFIRKQIKG